MYAHLPFAILLVAMPPMMRYTPHEMVAHVPPNGVMMGQRPMMMEQYHVQGEGAPMGLYACNVQESADKILY